MEKKRLTKRQIIKTAFWGAWTYVALLLVGIMLIGSLDGSKLGDTIFALVIPTGILSLFYKGPEMNLWLIAAMTVFAGAAYFVLVRMAWVWIGNHISQRSLQIRRVIKGCTITLLVLFFSSPLFLQKSSVPLYNGKNQVALATHSSLFPTGDTRIFARKNFKFRIAHDTFEYPVLIHPLDDGHKFLCAYVGDTEEFVFVVDETGSNANTSTNLFWASFVVQDCDALVRLPTESEVTSTMNWLNALSGREYRAASLPISDYGFIRIYVPTNRILSLLKNAPLHGSGSQPFQSSTDPLFERTFFANE